MRLGQSTLTSPGGAAPFEYHYRSSIRVSRHLKFVQNRRMRLRNRRYFKCGSKKVRIHSCQSLSASTMSCNRNCPSTMSSVSRFGKPPQLAREVLTNGSHFHTREYCTKQRNLTTVNGGIVSNPEAGEPQGQMWIQHRVAIRSPFSMHGPHSTAPQVVT